MKAMTLLCVAVLPSFAACGTEADDEIYEGYENAELAQGGCGDSPEGAYRCTDIGDYPIEVCRGGRWQVYGECDCYVKSGDSRKPAYAATCTYLAPNAAACDFAGVQCAACWPGEPCESTCRKCVSQYDSDCCP
jgi:hypothetical protein